VVIGVDPHKRIDAVVVLGGRGLQRVGKNLAQRLVAGGETVPDVSTRKSSLVRALATNSGRKTDDTDAYSVALVGLKTQDLPVVDRDERTEVLRLLSQRRRELVGLRTQAVCRLHRELVIHDPRRMRWTGCARPWRATSSRTWSRSTSGSPRSTPRSGPRWRPAGRS
jgi:hypothetical protein